MYGIIVLSFSSAEKSARPILAPMIYIYNDQGQADALHSMVNSISHHGAYGIYPQLQLGKSTTTLLVTLGSSVRVVDAYAVTQWFITTCHQLRSLSARSLRSHSSLGVWLAALSSLSSLHEYCMVQLI